MMCKIYKTLENAVIPVKAHLLDEGCDLTIIKVDKIIDKYTTRYDTGLVCEPPQGYHVELLPRSSISNSGYILSNSVGLVDTNYRGTLKVVLTKINPESPDLVLPCKMVQMVLRENIPFCCIEWSELLKNVDEREDGGFGSTG